MCCDAAFDLSGKSRKVMRLEVREVAGKTDKRGLINVLFAQVLMGRRNRPWMSHSVGAAHILKSRGYAGPKDEFERILMLSLRGPVVRVPVLHM